MTRSRSWKKRLGQQVGTGRAMGDLVDRPRSQPKLARLLLAVSIAAIFFCALFPFDLDFRDISGRISRRFDTGFSQYFTAADTIENILFFVPLGFAVAAVMPRRTRRTRQLQAMFSVVAVALGAAISTTVELLQCLLAERDPSLTDLVNNAIGAGAGYFVYFFVGKPLLIAAGRVVDRTQARMGASALAILTAIFAGAICAAPLVLGANAGKLSIWNPSYLMCAGNEIGGSRWWDGRIWNLSIASRAASRPQVGDLLGGRAPEDVFAASLVACYDLRGHPPFIDRAQRLAPLQLASQVAAATTQPHRAPATTTTRQHSTTSFAPATRTTRPALLPAAPADEQPWQQSRETWLRTAEPVDPLVDAIARSNQFTVKFTAASDSPDQHLDARLLTVSMGVHTRNLTFAQDGPNLTVRMRTSATGENGTAPRFVVPGVFADSAPRTIVATFSDSVLHVYIDRVAWEESARITPEATAIWWLYPRPDWSYQMTGRGDEVVIAGMIYRAMAFLPLGALVAASVNQFRRHHRERVLIVIGAMSAAVMLFEGLITTVGGQGLHAGNLLASIIFGAVGVSVIGIRKELPWSQWG